MLPLSALFLRDAGGIQPILAGEDPAPGNPSFPILFSIGVPVVARNRTAGGNDDIAVTVELRSPIGNRHDAILSGLPDHPRLVAEVGAPAADRPEGITYGTLRIIPTLDGSGGVAFQAGLFDMAHNHGRSIALFAEREGRVRFVFETGQQAVGQPGGVLLTSFEEAGRNRRGNFALVGKLDGAGINFGWNHLVILSDRSGIWETIAQTGDAPPGLRGTATRT